MLAGPQELGRPALPGEAPPWAFLSGGDHGHVCLPLGILFLFWKQSPRVRGHVNLLQGGIKLAFTYLVTCFSQACFSFQSAPHQSVYHVPVPGLEEYTLVTEVDLVTSIIEGTVQRGDSNIKTQPCKQTCKKKKKKCDED